MSVHNYLPEGWAFPENYSERSTVKERYASPQGSNPQSEMNRMIKMSDERGSSYDVNLDPGFTTL